MGRFNLSSNCPSGDFEVTDTADFGDIRDTGEACLGIFGEVIDIGEPVLAIVGEPIGAGDSVLMILGVPIDTGDAVLERGISIRSSFGFSPFEVFGRAAWSTGLDSARLCVEPFFHSAPMFGFEAYCLKFA